MATIEEMATVLYDIGATPMPTSRVKESFRRVLREVEKKGRSHISKYEGDMCTYWRVGSYKVIHLTDDFLFFAEMLTDEMMDDLIIEEV